MVAWLPELVCTVPVSAKAPRPVPPTLLRYWYTCALSATPVVLVRLAGALTLTCSPGRNARPDANVRAVVPPPLSTPVRRPDPCDPNTRSPWAEAAVMGCVNCSVTALPTGTWLALAAGALALTDNVVGTVKETQVVAVPAGVVTRKRPVVALAGTVASTSLADTTVNMAGMLLSVTLLTCPRLRPVRRTTAPALPRLGAKVRPATGGINRPALDVVPAGVVTWMGPAVTLYGACVRISTSDTTANWLAAKPLNWTAVAPVKPLPPITTFV